ncbi:MAG: hypothetical protein V3V16_09845 [Melioribacteraceae bacterium]
MRVKIFSKKEGYFKKTSTTSTELEQEINSWLENNSRMKVIKIEQTSSGGNIEPAVHIISVWYEIKD